MAEALLRRILQKEAPEKKWLVSSAGTWTEAGYPATPFCVKAMMELNIDTSSHRSQPISAELLDQYALILTMESGHKEAIQVEFPNVASRVFMLSEMSGQVEPVKDPIGGSFRDYQNTAHEINTWIETGLTRILELLQEPDGPSM